MPFQTLQTTLDYFNAQVMFRQLTHHSCTPHSVAQMVDISVPTTKVVKWIQDVDGHVTIKHKDLV